MNKIKGLCKKCLICETEFRSDVHKRKYCSEECFKESVKIRQKKYLKDNKKEIRKRRTTCKYCGNSFKVHELKNRCCGGEQCQEDRKKEKSKLAQKRHYNRNVKKTTNKFKKRDAENARNYRKNHQEEINKRDRLRKKEKRNWVNSIKKKSKCEKCNEEKWFCLDFHHKDPTQKDFTISNCISMGYGKKRILKEIEKCIVLCSNCHRHLHYLELNEKEWKLTNEWLNKGKL
jgi:hypothetical protein